MKLFVVITAFLLAASAQAARDPQDCEVCIKALDDIGSKLSAEDRKDLLKIESVIGKYCAKPPSEKEVKLVSCVCVCVCVCYALKVSALGTPLHSCSRATLYSPAAYFLTCAVLLPGSHQAGHLQPVQERRSQR